MKYTLNEDEFNTSSVSKSKEFQRGLLIARTLNIVQDAIGVAEKNNDSEKLIQLKEKETILKVALNNKSPADIYSDKDDLSNGDGDANTTDDFDDEEHNDDNDTELDDENGFESDEENESEDDFDDEDEDEDDFDDENDLESDEDESEDNDTENEKDEEENTNTTSDKSSNNNDRDTDSANSANNASSNNQNNNESEDNKNSNTNDTELNNELSDETGAKAQNQKTKPPVKDIFGMNKNGQFGLGDGNDQEPVDPDADDIVKMLKTLSGDSKSGAIRALQDILKNPDRLKENLSEAFNPKTDNLLDVSDEDFDEEINKILNLVDSVKKVRYSTDIETRINKIKSDLEDAETLNQINAEDAINLQADRAAIRAREKEKEKYKPKSFKSISDFKINLYNAIKNQVEENEEDVDTYTRINQRAEDDKLIKPGSYKVDVKSKDIPTIDVYFDQSGSWGAKDIEVGQKALAVLTEFERKKEIKLNIYYFSNDITTDDQDTMLHGGTHAWPKIIDNIIANKTKNVVIMTDDDIETLGDANKQSPIKVQGCVWYIWKNGLSSQSCVQHLFGKRGTYQYSF